MPKKGIFARVLKGGAIQPGDVIQVLGADTGSEVLPIVQERQVA